MSVVNTEFIQLCCEYDSRIRPLCVIIRYWAHRFHLTNKISAEKSGKRFLSNYALTIMIFFFLQKEEILPTVKELQDEMTSEENEKLNNWQFGYSKSILQTPQAEKSNRRSLSRLLYKFFDFYSDFDYKNVVISPFLGRPVTRETFEFPRKSRQILPSYALNVESGKNVSLDVKSALVVQDPFELNQNLTRKFSKGSLAIWRKMCDTARAEFHADKLFRVFELKHLPKKFVKREKKLSAKINIDKNEVSVDSVEVEDLPEMTPVEEPEVDTDAYDCDDKDRLFLIKYLDDECHDRYKYLLQSDPRRRHKDKFIVLVENIIDAILTETLRFEHKSSLLPPRGEAPFSLPPYLPFGHFPRFPNRPMAPPFLRAGQRMFRNPRFQNGFFQGGPPGCAPFPPNFSGPGFLGPPPFVSPAYRTYMPPEGPVPYPPPVRYPRSFPQGPLDAFYDGPVVGIPPSQIPGTFGDNPSGSNFQQQEVVEANSSDESSSESDTGERRPEQDCVATNISAESQVESSNLKTSTSVVESERAHSQNDDETRDSQDREGKDESSGGDSDPQTQREVPAADDNGEADVMRKFYDEINKDKTISANGYTKYLHEAETEKTEKKKQEDAIEKFLAQMRKSQTSDEPKRKKPRRSRWEPPDESEQKPEKEVENPPVERKRLSEVEYVAFFPIWDFRKMARKTYNLYDKTLAAEEAITERILEDYFSQAPKVAPALVLKVWAHHSKMYEGSVCVHMMDLQAQRRVWFGASKFLKDFIPRWTKHVIYYGDVKIDSL